VIREIYIHDERAARRVLALQLRSYAVEARFIGTTEIPPLRDTVDALRRCGETFYGYFDGEAFTAVVSYKIRGPWLDIHRLFVSPDHLRKGRASALLRFVETADIGVERITVSTGSKNTPAGKLYIAHGFVSTGEFEASPGLFVTRFEKTVRRLAAPSDGC
jgi:GNAT superfamily N-acetyltransferase